MAERIATVDVVLAGAGIMSATLGMLLKQLQPDISISIFERLDMAAATFLDDLLQCGALGHDQRLALRHVVEDLVGNRRIRVFGEQVRNHPDVGFRDERRHVALIDPSGQEQVFLDVQLPGQGTQLRLHHALADDHRERARIGPLDRRERAHEHVEAALRIHVADVEQHEAGMIGQLVDQW